MDEQYNSAFTGQQIDEAINKVQNQAPILAGAAQTLTDAQKAQARKNIGATTLSATIAFFETVAEMQASEGLSVGFLVETCGYYSARDGGACVYKVIAETEKSYDIKGNGVAFRPIVNGVAYPKMFGTYNDGETADNVPLQACFDYVADYGVTTIDGGNLTYYVNHSTDAITTQDQAAIYPDGLTHHGVIIRTGVELKNYKSVLMPYTDINTPILTLIQSESNSYHIHDCEFDGNYGNHEERPSGTGTDGGRHLLFFTYEDTIFPDDFRACGDITIERCKLYNPDSYPIAISACDCTYTVRECDIKSHAMGILTYATNCIIRDCSFSTADHYKAMVHNFCHDEIEFGSNYTGGKVKNIEITNCRVSAPAIYRVHQDTQVGLNYGTIKIIDCVNEYENGDIYVDHLDVSAYDTRKTIDNIEIRGCSVPSEVTDSSTDKNLRVVGANVAQVVVEDTLLTSCSFANSNVNKIIFKDLKNEWAFTMKNSDGYTLEEVVFNNVVFNSVDVPILEQASGVKNIKIKNCTSKNRLQIVSASSTVTVLNILVDNFIYEELDTSACTFIDVGESGEYNITIKDAQFLTAWNSYSMIYVPSGSAATGRIVLQNVVAVDLPIANQNLELVKLNVSFISGDSGYILTDSDKTEIAEIVKAEVPLVKTAKQPTFVGSVDKMTDTGEVYVLASDGHLWAYMTGKVDILTADDFAAGNISDEYGTLYTGSTSLFNRIATKELIPLTDKKISVYCPSPYQYFVYYYTGDTVSTYIGKTAWKSGDIDDVLTDTLSIGTASGAKYCRISLRDYTDANANLTDRIDEFMSNIIVKRTSIAGAEWADTGLMYNQPADYEERIVALENLVAELQAKVN